MLKFGDKEKEGETQIGTSSSDKGRQNLFVLAAQRLRSVAAMFCQGHSFTPFACCPFHPSFALSMSPPLLRLHALYPFVRENIRTYDIYFLPFPFLLSFSSFLFLLVFLLVLFLVLRIVPLKFDDSSNMKIHLLLPPFIFNLIPRRSSTMV